MTKLHFGWPFIKRMDFTGSNSAHLTGISVTIYDKCSGFFRYTSLESSFSTIQSCQDILSGLEVASIFVRENVKALFIP